MRERRGPRVARIVLGVVLSSMLACALSGRARANDFEEFETARNAYESQDYAHAATLFEALGGGDTPALSNRSLLMESKKYLAASYLFLGKLQRAEVEFDRLLRLDPLYILDPLGFPEEVQRLFQRVKTRVDAERKVAEVERQREAERLSRSLVQRETEERQRWAKLTRLAETEHVREIRTRWVALMPFGIGQVQNGHASLAAVLAVSEGSMFLISFVSWVVHDNLRGQTPAANQRDEFSVTERVSRYTNQISLGLFGALALTGIIDAQVRFQGDQEYLRKRNLPADLRQGPSVSLGAGGLRLRLNF